MSNVPDGIGSLQNLVVLMLTQNKIKNLPLSVLKLKNLNALWLSENQSKPLTPLQNDYEDETGKHILTCYLLPQREDSFIGKLFIVFVNYTLICFHYYYLFIENENKDLSLKPIKTNTRIRFTTEDIILEEPRILMRVPTPHPKKMRAFAKMLLERKKKNDVIKFCT